MKSIKDYPLFSLAIHQGTKIRTDIYWAETNKGQITATVYDFSLRERSLESIEIFYHEEH